MPTGNGEVGVALATDCHRSAPPLPPPPTPPRAGGENGGAHFVESLERERGFAPPTSSLARKHSTAELLPHIVKCLEATRGVEPLYEGFVPQPSSGGHGRNRTAEYRFCRPVPYHLATWPHVLRCRKLHHGSKCESETQPSPF